MTAYTYSLLAALVWGIAPIFEKYAMGRLPPMTGLFLRCAGVTAGSLFLLKAAPGWDQMRTAGAVPVLCFVAAGALASVLGQVFSYNAISRAEVSQVTPVMGAWPLVVVVFGWLCLGEAFTARKLAGTVLIVAGTWLLRP